VSSAFLLYHRRRFLPSQLTPGAQVLHSLGPATATRKGLIDTDWRSSHDRRQARYVGLASGAQRTAHSIRYGMALCTQRGCRLRTSFRSENQSAGPVGQCTTSGAQLCISKRSDKTTQHRQHIYISENVLRAAAGAALHR
jgi:hypothetical protein